VHEVHSASPTSAKADIGVDGLRAVLTKCMRKPKLRGYRRWRSAIMAACGIAASCSQSAGPRDIAVNTEPPGAVCDLIQANTITATVNPTPGSAHVASTLPDITFVCRHAGFHDAIYFREWSVGNIAVGGRTGRAVDEMLGVDYAAPVNIVMRNPTPAEAEAIGEDAYIYGYPLITMDLTRQVTTNVAAPEGLRAPVGQFANAREFPTAASRDVTAPNADTLYSSAWLDLSKVDRYYLMPMLSGWTEAFQVPGKRTTGNKAQTYAITGPGWTGPLPAGVTQYKSPTNLVWIIGQTYSTGTPEDYKAVHAIQDQYKLVPLSAYGKPYTPPQGMVDPGIEMSAPVRDQVNRMDAATYFKRLARLMKDNPPVVEDAAIVARMAQIGIVPGQDFDIGKLDPAVAQAVQSVPKLATERIMAHLKAAGAVVNGWDVVTKTGLYGTDYLQRALISAVSLGANRPQDAVSPVDEVDQDGNPLNGANNKYVMHFAKDETPPVNALWSLTMYDDRYFFVANPLNKYIVSLHDALKYNADGSLDVYVQNQSPGVDWETNWLPAPTDKFILMLRMYSPKEQDPSILNKSWKVPAVTPIQ